MLIGIVACLLLSLLNQVTSQVVDRTLTLQPFYVAHVVPALMGMPPSESNEQVRAETTDLFDQVWRDQLNITAGYTYRESNCVLVQVHYNGGIPSAEYNMFFAYEASINVTHDVPSSVISPEELEMILFEQIQSKDYEEFQQTTLSKIQFYKSISNTTIGLTADAGTFRPTVIASSPPSVMPSVSPAPSITPPPSAFPTAFTGYRVPLEPFYISQRNPGFKRKPPKDDFRRMRDSAQRFVDRILRRAFPGSGDDDGGGDPEPKRRRRLATTIASISITEGDEVYNGGIPESSYNIYASYGGTTIFYDDSTRRRRRGLEEVVDDRVTSEELIELILNASTTEFLSDFLRPEENFGLVEQVAFGRASDVLSFSPSFSAFPSVSPTESAQPSMDPTRSLAPSLSTKPTESAQPSIMRSYSPSVSIMPSHPTNGLSATPTIVPSATPTIVPIAPPTIGPTATPTIVPTASPTAKPTPSPTNDPCPCRRIQILCRLLNRCIVGYREEEEDE